MDPVEQARCDKLFDATIQAMQLHVLHPVRRRPGNSAGLAGAGCPAGAMGAGPCRSAGPSG